MVMARMSSIVTSIVKNEHMLAQKTALRLRKNIPGEGIRKMTIRPTTVHPDERASVLKIQLGKKNLKSPDLALIPTSDTTSAHISGLLHPEPRLLNLGSDCRQLGI